MIVLLIICLVITMYVIEHYVVSGFHSKSHRLLPLVLGLIALYDFYVIIEYISNSKQIFVTLKDLLLMQTFFLLLCYIIDFIKVNFPVWCYGIIFFIYSLFNVLVVTQLSIGGKYRNLILAGSIFSMVFTMGMATWAFMKKQKSRIEKWTYIMLYVAIFIPAIALSLTLFGIVPEQIFMPISLAITCLIIDGLLASGYILDTESILKNDIYNTTDFAIILFDKDLFFIDANSVARECFSDIIELVEGKKTGHRYMSYLNDWTDNIQGNNEVQIQNKFYNCVMQELFFRKKLKGYLLQVYDITEHKERIKDKSIFLANMSHDLRSPLHAIIAGSDIMLSRNEMSMRNRFLVQQIMTAGNNLLDSVNQILDYSKMEAGKLELKEARYNFHRLLSSQYHLMTMNLSNRPIDFNMRMMTEYPEHLYGDDMRVLRVLQNVLSNAEKYTEEGSIDCRIWCNIDREQKDVELRIEVEDTGSGISKERQQAIFEEYSGDTRTSIKESTGLGLSIVNQLAKMMNGGVSVQSDGIKGTTMTIIIHQGLIGEKINPPELMVGDEQFSLHSSFKESVEIDWIYPEARILVADDLAVNRQIIADYSTNWKMKVDAVADGDEAVIAAKNRDYQLIILDVMMPKLSGPEAAEEIRKITKVPIIGFSASEENSELFNDFIPKPVELEKLKEIFDKYIPESYRKKPDIEQSQLIQPKSDTTNEGYYRTLKTYVMEVSAIRDQIDEYYNDNLDLFRIKVHGIKGISRQLNRPMIADHAEIMEMAAKAGHLEFIENHLDEFKGDLQAVLDEAIMELKYLAEKMSYQEVGRIISRDENKIGELIQEIRQGFLSYNVSQIEGAVKEMEKYELTQEESEKLEKVKLACEEFEYEAGAEIF